jgi:hypothetical protein
VVGTELAKPLATLIQRERVGAVISYTCNGVADLPLVRGRDGSVASMFETLGIPHLMFWWDHPHWAHSKVGLQARLQPALRSANGHHFLKSDAAAAELRGMLGWANCHKLLPGADVQLVGSAVSQAPEFDVVTVVGQPGVVDERLASFLDDDDPDVARIIAVYTGGIEERLAQGWLEQAPAGAHAALEALARAWVERKRARPHVASWWHFEELKASFGGAVRWLEENPAAYFTALQTMWAFGAWRRTFVIQHLARRCRVRVLGADWSIAGVPSDPEWVEHSQLAATLGRGRAALSVAQGHDEEGVILKPFEIVATGVPMVADRTPELERSFDAGAEVEMFRTPGECWSAVKRLLAEPERAKAMAAAAMRRLQAEHLWRHRLQDALTYAGLAMGDFRGSGACASGQVVLSLNFSVQWAAAPA